MTTEVTDIQEQPYNVSLVVTPSLVSEDNSEGKNIRVNVELLDFLMSLVGEVVLARNQFSRIIHDNNDSTIRWTSQSL